MYNFLQANMELPL